MTTIAVPDRGSQPCHDHAALMQRVGEDEATVRELLALFETDVAARLAALEQALAARDPATVAAAAHSICGMSLVFSGEFAARVAAAIETSARAGELADVAALVPRLREEARALVAEITAALSSSAVAGGEP